MVAKTRITKEPEVRRKELIDAAEELFTTLGCDETTVSDIVNKVGVTQGLFYYYFKSKEEIVSAVAERYVDEVMVEIVRICDNDRLDAISKLKTIFSAMFSLMSQNKKLIFFLHQERNELLHYQLGHKYMCKAIPLAVAIIEQGVRERVFQVEHPRETAELLLAGMGYMPSMFSQSSDDLAGFAKKFLIIMGIMEKTLGAPEGSLRIQPDVLLRGQGEDRSSQRPGPDSPR